MNEVICIDLMMNAMKGLAVFPIDTLRLDTVGLAEKMYALVAACKSHDLAVDAYATARNSLSKLDYSRVVATDPGNDSVRYRYWSFWNDLLSLKLSSYTWVWVRAHPMSYTQRRFLLAAKAAGCKVFYDYPTYPVTGELTLKSKLVALVSPKEADIIKRCVHRVVTLSQDKTIHGVETVQVANGCPPFRKIAFKPKRADEPIHIVGLGQWANWHGLDEVFRAFSEGPNKNQVKFTFAGTGPASAELRALGERYNLQITWLPNLVGQERDDLLAEAGLGLGSLGVHRKAVFPDRSLKHRLYASRGLPFVCSTGDDAFANCEAVYQIPYGTQQINAEAIIAFGHFARKEREKCGLLLADRTQSLQWRNTYAPLFEALSLASPI